MPDETEVAAKILKAVKSRPKAPGTIVAVLRPKDAADARTIRGEIRRLVEAGKLIVTLDWKLKPTSG